MAAQQEALKAREELSMAVASAYVLGVLAMCLVCAYMADGVARRRMRQGRASPDAVYHLTAIAATIPCLLLLYVGEGPLGFAAAYLTWLGLWRRHARELRVRHAGWTRLHAAAHALVIACVLLSVKSGQDATTAFVTGASVGMVMLIVTAIVRGRATRQHLTA